MPWKYLLYKSSIFLLLIPIAWIILSIFTYVNYNIYNVDKIEKVTFKMFSNNSNSKSYHEEKNVIFTYFNGDVKVTAEERFDLRSSSALKRYKALTEEHKYYKLNDIFVDLMAVASIGLVILVLIAIVHFNYSDNIADGFKDWEKITGFKSSIVKQIMTFCNVPFDNVQYPSDHTWKIPSYKQIWNTFKQQ